MNRGRSRLVTTRRWHKDDSFLGSTPIKNLKLPKHSLPPRALASAFFRRQLRILLCTARQLMSVSRRGHSTQVLDCEDAHVATISFMLNGRPAKADVADDTPLIFVLRNDLGCKGTRLGCGEGQCASCTVLVNGRPVTSCNLAVGAVAGSDVETVESLTGAGSTNPLLESFIREQAGQCGYCLSGILMRSTALLRQNPRPSRAEVLDALDAHICRCGAHARIIRAIERAGAEAPP